jgi:hypothetical protein
VIAENILISTRLLYMTWLPCPVQRLAKSYHGLKFLKIFFFLPTLISKFF